VQTTQPPCPLRKNPVCPDPGRQRVGRDVAVQISKALAVGVAICAQAGLDRSRYPVDASHLEVREVAMHGRRPRPSVAHDRIALTNDRVHVPTGERPVRFLRCRRHLLRMPTRPLPELLHVPTEGTAPEALPPRRRRGGGRRRASRRGSQSGTTRTGGPSRERQHEDARPSVATEAGRGGARPSAATSENQRPRETANPIGGSRLSSSSRAEPWLSCSRLAVTHPGVLPPLRPALQPRLPSRRLTATHRLHLADDPRSMLGELRV